MRAGSARSWRTVGEAALAGQLEWALMHRQRPREHNRI